MEPVRACKRRLPVNTPGLDAADRRSRPIIQHAAWPRRGAELREIQTGSIALRPLDPCFDTQLTRAVGDQMTKGIVRKARDPEGRSPKPGGGDRDVELATADVKVERVRLLQPLKIGRSQADHRFAESHQEHAKSYELR